MLVVLCKTPTKSHVWHISRLSFIITRKWRRSCTQCFLHFVVDTLRWRFCSFSVLSDTFLSSVSTHTLHTLTPRWNCRNTPTTQSDKTRDKNTQHLLFVPTKQNDLNIHSFNRDRGSSHVFIIFTHFSNNRWLQFSCGHAQEADVVRNVHCVKVVCYVMDPFLRWKKACIWLIRPCTRYNSCMQ